MTVLLIAHVCVALTGLVVATAGLLKVSQKLMTASHWLSAATISSGTVLTVISQRDILSNCLSGLSYLGAIMIFSAITKYRLATESSK